ncbi:MAG: carboxypeptidase M32 [Spirochaetes bacterium]|nr:carboxypeptidase M32 [Spirochaetota bacterium]
MTEKLDNFIKRWARISRLEQTAAVLGWDMETFMPEEGVKPRSEQIALLSEISHQWLVAPETRCLIEEAENESSDADYFSDSASMLRVARRLYEQKVKLPEGLVSRIAGTTALANSIWIDARKKSDFSLFAPVLEEIVGLCREEADLLGYQAHPYDALLDLHEPGLTTAQVEELFDKMKEELLPLVREIAGRTVQSEPDFLTGKFDIAGQEAFGLKVLHDMQYDFRRGRQDRSAHPFTTSFTPYDVRITTRFDENDLFSALFSTIHEGGHALYDQGLPVELVDTPLCQPISLGVHESQSRLWENIIGRSRGFWSHYLPVLKKFFPGRLDRVNLEDFYRAANRVRPGFIRVESDELTYNLHIFIRFEIEKQLIDGTLAVKDIPGEWDGKYRDYLGISPPNDALGSLQDIHWAHGSIGYFPTYTIGNLMAAQLYSAAVHDIPSIPSDIEAGNMATMLSWLRKNVHRHGSRYTCTELVREITGGEIQIKPFIEYLAVKFRDIYR